MTIGYIFLAIIITESGQPTGQMTFFFEVDILIKNLPKDECQR